MHDVKAPAHPFAPDSGWIKLEKWLVKIGDVVKQDQPIANLETEHFTLELNADCAGVIAEIWATEGDNVTVGSTLCRIDYKAAVASEIEKEDIVLKDSDFD